MNIKIRQATINDAEAIVNVHTTTWKYSYKGFIADEELAKRNPTPERILKMQDAIQQQLFYVAEVDNQIVAFSGLHGQLGSTSEIGLMYVLPQYQGLGIGRQLFQDFLDNHLCQDCQQFMLKCLAIKWNNTTRAFILLIQAGRVDLMV